MRRWLVAVVVASLGLTGCGSATVAATPEHNSPTSLSTASATPSTSAAASPAASAGAALTVVLTGELFWQDLTWVAAQLDAEGSDSAYAFAPMLDGVKNLVSTASLAVCHEEVPIAATGSTYSGFPSYAVPPEVVPAIKDTGFDLCTANSEHTLDKGIEGASTTLAQLRDKGLVTVGAYRTQQESTKPVIVEVNGVKIGIVAGTENRGSTKLAAEKSWVVDLLNADTMIAKAKAARAAGAQIVIAMMHAGQDGTTAPTEKQKEIADKLTKASEIDLVYGHGAHTVQPITKVNGKWVLYGLGSLVSQPPSDQTTAFESVIARATFTTSGSGYTVSELTYFPTTTSVYSSGHAIRVRLTSDAIKAGGDTSALKESQERVRTAVGSAQGLTEG
ncbi:CapA family protein [Propionicicella superfundia]|uniref:CapA family protein n=1 Tax=Propionicicella superfundia TaxID=348582 RepID=UPI0006879610|nr:CapA family protein [Propionicicella superfundia]